MEKPPFVKGADPESFAHYTLTKRYPAIIDAVIATNDYDLKTKERLMDLREAIPVLKVEYLPYNEAEDTFLWNELIRPYVGQSIMDTSFFFAEMYLYRLMLEAIRFFDEPVADLFFPQKQQGLAHADEDIQHLAAYIHKLEATSQAQLKELPEFLAIALWGNRADLSLTPGQNDGLTYQVLDLHADKVLINEIAEVGTLLTQLPNPGRVDMIMDNAGFELIADFALIDYLLTSYRVESMVLHVKAYPVFVSDATQGDIQSSIVYLQTHPHGPVKAWGNRLAEYIDNNRLVVMDDPFWTTPQYFTELPGPVRHTLKKADLIISKGDANYRRFLEDRYWPLTTAVEKVLPKFPAPCLALRTLKCEVQLGLDPAQITDLNQQDKDWMISGRYGVMQMMYRNSL